MKKYLLIISILFIGVSIYAQEEQTEPKKFASWTISEAFQAEPGFAGSYWKPTFNIAIDQFGCYCVVNLYNANGYYMVNSQSLPHLYMKTDKDEIVELVMDPDEPIHKIYLNGYFSARTWMPGRYVTRLIYQIPDIDQFLSKYYVKYRVWLGEGFKDVELGSSYSKKFNKRLKNAYEEVLKKFNAKQNTLDNPLEGF